MPDDADEELVERAIDGHVPSIARLITRLENRAAATATRCCAACTPRAAART